MANFCDFNIKITGEKRCVETMIAMMRHEGEYQKNGLGRIFDIDVMEFNETPLPGVYEAICWGDCAWSIKSAMRDDGVRERSLESECKRLNLVVEGYSSEPGERFQEHLLIVKGDVVIDDCVEYEEHVIDSYVSLEQYNKDHNTQFTKDMIKDGAICIGGFGDEYCDFADTTKYFMDGIDMEKMPLDPTIETADNGSNEPYRDLLPERCYGILAMSGEIIVIARGETGYYKTDFGGQNAEENQALVDAFNEKLGVSKAQAAAMSAGSMFGWNVPAANPNVYDEQGKLVSDTVNSVNEQKYEPIMLEELEVCALYDSGDEFYSIVKAPNEKYFNYYSKDGLQHGYGSAGPFDSFEEAESMMFKHRPAAREETARIEVTQETVDSLAENGKAKIGNSDRKAMDDLDSRIALADFLKGEGKAVQKISVSKTGEER